MGAFGRTRSLGCGQAAGAAGAWGFMGRAHGGEAHHGRQREALVPLRVGRLLQDLAAELENTGDRWMEQHRDSGLLGGPKASQWPFSVMLATFQAGKKALRTLGSCAVDSDTGIFAETKSSVLGQT